MPWVVCPTVLDEAPQVVGDGGGLGGAPGVERDCSCVCLCEWGGGGGRGESEIGEGGGVFMITPIKKAPSTASATLILLSILTLHLLPL